MSKKMHPYMVHLPTYESAYLAWLMHRAIILTGTPELILFNKPHPQFQIPNASLVLFVCF